MGMTFHSHFLKYLPILYADSCNKYYIIYNHRVLIKVLSVFSAAAFGDASATTNDEDNLFVGASSEKVRVVIPIRDLVIM